MATQFLHYLAGCSKHVVTNLAVKQVPPTQEKKAWKAQSALKLGGGAYMYGNAYPLLCALIFDIMKYFLGNTQLCAQAST